MAIWLGVGALKSGGADAADYDARVTASIRRGADPDGAVQLDGDGDGVPENGPC